MEDWSCATLPELERNMVTQAAMDVKKRDHRQTIFLLEEDDQTRQPLLKNLRRQGYRVIVGVDEESAQDLISSAYAQVDLVLINLVGKSLDEALRVGRAIRDEANDEKIPVVVMAEEYGKDIEGTEVNVQGNDWLFYLGEEPHQLSRFIVRLLS